MSTNRLRLCARPAECGMKLFAHQHRLTCERLIATLHRGSSRVLQGTRWGLDSHQREPYFEYRAFDRSALDSELSAMRVGDPSRNRETQAASCVGLFLAQIRLIEAIKDVLTDFARHADACVSDDDHGLLAD